MSEPAKMEVTKLENDIVEVRHLAAHADKEASDNTAVLRGKVGILNAIRADQLKLEMTVAGHGKRLDRLERKVDDGFAEMRSEISVLDSEMRRGFSVLGQGQQKITELLEARDDPEET